MKKWLPILVAAFTLGVLITPNAASAATSTGPATPVSSSATGASIPGGCWSTAVMNEYGTFWAPWNVGAAGDEIEGAGHGIHPYLQNQNDVFSFCHDTYNGYWCIQSEMNNVWVNGKFVSEQQGATGQEFGVLQVNRVNCQPWEFFIIGPNPEDPGRQYIRSAENHYFVGINYYFSWEQIQAMYSTLDVNSETAWWLTNDTLRHLIG